MHRAHLHIHIHTQIGNRWKTEWGGCVSMVVEGEKSALNQLTQTKRIIGGVVLSERYRSGEEGWDSEGVCLICTGVLPSSCSQLTVDIFIRLAHTVQRRNKFICKSTLHAKDKISTGWNIAVFHKEITLFYLCTCLGTVMQRCSTRPLPLCVRWSRKQKSYRILFPGPFWWFWKSECFISVFCSLSCLFLSAFSSRPSVGFSQKPVGLIPVSLHEESLLSSYTLV